MPPAPNASLLVAPRHSARQASASRRRSPRRREPRAQPARRALGSYTDARGRTREVLARRGAAESVLVIDRDALSHGDCRLVAHLSADEPPENADLVVGLYLRDAARGRGRCRRLTSEDARIAPPASGGGAEPTMRRDGEPVDPLGRRCRLELVAGRLSIPELRWRRHPPLGVAGEPHTLSVREAVASLESYEPVCTLTRSALACHEGREGVSTVLLRSELDRLQASPIVLNRRLREVLLATAERRALSMSEIASRCGRVKRDGRGKESGETSWLARRIGLLPEAGRSTPTPWVHSDVLALIARRGLGIAPREVELG